MLFCLINFGHNKFKINNISPYSLKVERWFNSKVMVQIHFWANFNPKRGYFYV